MKQASSSSSSNDSQPFKRTQPQSIIKKSIENLMLANKSPQVLSARTSANFQKQHMKPPTATLKNRTTQGTLRKSVSRSPPPPPGMLIGKTGQHQRQNSQKRVKESSHPFSNQVVIQMIPNLKLEHRDSESFSDQNQVQIIDKTSFNGRKSNEENIRNSDTSSSAAGKGNRVQVKEQEPFQVRESLVGLGKKTQVIDFQSLSQSKQSPNDMINHSLEFGQTRTFNQTQQLRASIGCNVDDEDDIINPPPFDYEEALFEGGLFESNQLFDGGLPTLNKINSTKHDWSDLISNYRTVQSPSKKQRHIPNTTYGASASGSTRQTPDKQVKSRNLIRLELIEEVKTIKIDADAIVSQGQSKGFFNRNNDDGVSQAFLDSILPQFEEIDTDLSMHAYIDSRNTLANEHLKQISHNERYKLISQFMKAKTLEVKKQKQHWQETHWKLPYLPQYQVKLGKQAPIIVYQDSIPLQDLQKDLSLKQEYLNQVKIYNNQTKEPNFKVNRDLFENHKQLQQQLIGSLDPYGNFLLSLQQPYVDPCNPDSLGFFKKIGYQDKMSSNRESIIQSYLMIREILDQEGLKGNEKIQDLIEWNTLKIEMQEFQQYIDEIIQKGYNLFNHPAPEYFVVQ